MWGRLGAVAAALTIVVPAVAQVNGGAPSLARPCPPVPANQGGPDGEPRTTTGTFPWPAPPPGVNPAGYAAYDHTPAVQPPQRPANWAADGADWKLTSARTTDPTVNRNPQELCGVEGNSVDTAWQVTTGRPDTIIAVTDSGIEWCNPSVVNKIYLNRAALPPPEDAAGHTATAGDPYDLHHTGVFNVDQYRDDPRIARPFFCGPFVSPEDLIRTFGGDGRTGPPGFTEAIAGWNFVDNNNDPYDDVHYDHGTGEAQDSTGAANTISGGVGSCPNCMVLPIRVGQSFVAGANDFAQAVLFAVDSGASVIQEALGTYDVTTTARQAIAYANAHGVPVIASAADEEAEHHNAPANLPGAIVVNSVTRSPVEGGVPLYHPAGYLFLNGCTNYGANIAITVESSSCSSEATGKTGGVAGLIESAARDLLEQGKLAPYPNLVNGTGAPVALSANEVSQLLTMSADDIDFRTPALPFGLPFNYAVVSPVPTTRYPTQPGYDMYTGYGRLNAGRVLSSLAAGRIPPEASFGGMDWFKTYDPTRATLQVTGRVASVRTGKPFGWRLQYGIGTQPAPGAWSDLASGQATGAGPVDVKLGPAQLQAIARGLPLLPGPDQYAFTLRLVVTDANGLVGMDRRTEFLHHDATLLTAAPVEPGGSIDAPPTLAPIGPGGSNAMIVATADGVIHAYTTHGNTLVDLPGWPVRTVALDSHAAEPAYATGGVAIPHGTIVGGVAVGDLNGSGQVDVVASDLTGRVYAWDGHGQLLAPFPVRTNPAYSAPAGRDKNNRLMPGILAAPALAHLEGPAQLDIVAAAMDRHVYAWRPDGTPVPGWPALVVDRSQVQSVDPVTQSVQFTPSSHVTQGSKLIDTPAIGSLLGDGRQDVVVGANEEYRGTPNVSIASPVNWVLGHAPLLSPGNSRVYALGPDGRTLPGWPAAIADLETGLLPDVGDGTVASPVLADLAGNGRLETGIMTTVGPAYVLRPDGGSYLGAGPDGKPIVLSTEPTGPLASSPQYPSVPALGMPVFAPLGPAAPGISLIAPAASIGKAIDVFLPDQQVPNDSQLDAWSTTTGRFQLAFPQKMNDLQFLAQPIVADVGGAAAGPYVVAGSSLYDVRAVNALGLPAPGFPKFTGGWMVNSPSFGPFSDVGQQVVAVGTREGDLFVWTTPTARCAASGPWPREHHDLWNTGNLETRGAPGSGSPGAGGSCGG